MTSRVKPENSQDDEFQTETIYDRLASTISSPAGPTTRDQMNIVEASGTLDFWADPSENIYDEGDGVAV